MTRDDRFRISSRWPTSNTSKTSNWACWDAIKPPTPPWHWRFLAELRAWAGKSLKADIRRGLAEVRFPARVEVVSRHPTIVIDAAHNVASIEALLETLDESFQASVGC